MGCPFGLSVTQGCLMVNLPAILMYVIQTVVGAVFSVTNGYK